MPGSSKEEGYTLTELMVVIGIVGLLAFPEVGHVRTAAKLTGVQTNFRSVITAVCGLRTGDDAAAKLTAQFGDSRRPEVEDLKNPITDKAGVATDVPQITEQTAAVYVLAANQSAVPSANSQSAYRGAVVAIVHEDNRVVVYGCDEDGKLMTGLQMTVHL